MIVSLLIGFPGQRPGGLLLSILSAIAAGAAAVLLGLVYATACVRAPRLTLALQGSLALLRGVPLILLIFFLGQVTTLPLVAIGFTALGLYSLAHVGETLRAYLATYPPAMRDQAKVMNLGPIREWWTLRVAWTLHRSLDALGTHWISLLKDTGALTVLGIGELTTVARLLSERSAMSHWMVVLAAAAGLYLAAVLSLVWILARIRNRLVRSGA